MDCSIISTSFRSLTPLNDIQGEGNWHTEAMIVGWEVHTFDENHPIKCSSNNINSHICISDYVITLARKFLWGLYIFYNNLLSHTLFFLKKIKNKK